MKELEEDNIDQVILDIGNKLTGQEIWYWESLVHLYREYKRRFENLTKEHIEKIDRVNELREKYENLLTDYRISIEKRVKLDQKIDKIDKLINETIDEPLVEEDRFQYFYDKYWELRGDKE